MIDDCGDECGRLILPHIHVVHGILGHGAMVRALVIYWLLGDLGLAADSIAAAGAVGALRRIFNGAGRVCRGRSYGYCDGGVNQFREDGTIHDLPASWHRRLARLVSVVPDLAARLGGSRWFRESRRIHPHKNYGSRNFLALRGARKI